MFKFLFLSLTTLVFFTFNNVKAESYSGPGTVDQPNVVGEGLQYPKFPNLNGDSKPIILFGEDNPEDGPEGGDPQQGPRVGDPDEGPKGGSPEEDPDFGSPEEDPDFGSPEEDPDVGNPKKDPEVEPLISLKDILELMPERPTCGANEKCSSEGLDDEWGQLLGAWLREFSGEPINPCFSNSSLCDGITNPGNPVFIEMEESGGQLLSLFSGYPDICREAICVDGKYDYLLEEYSGLDFRQFDPSSTCPPDARCIPVVGRVQCEGPDPEECKDDYYESVAEVDSELEKEKKEKEKKEEEAKEEEEDVQDAANDYNEDKKKEKDKTAEEDKATEDMKGQKKQAITDSMDPGKTEQERKAALKSSQKLNAEISVREERLKKERYERRETMKDHHRAVMEKEIKEYEFARGRLAAQELKTRALEGTVDVMRALKEDGTRVTRAEAERIYSSRTQDNSMLFYLVCKNNNGCLDVGQQVGFDPN